MENFTIIEQLCKTQFSTVYKCKSKKTKEVVVLKEVWQKGQETPTKEILREILVLMNFKHPNVVNFHSVFVNGTNVVLEMEFCQSSLTQVITSVSKPFHLAQVKKILKSIAEGLKYLHDNDVMHRDVKPGNIFIDENSVVKLGDFGSSRIKNHSIRTVTPSVGTKWYKAPEVIFGRKDYNKSVDIWSLGCIMAELFLLEPLFPGNTDFEMVNFIFSLLGFSEEDDKLFQPAMEIKHKEKDTQAFKETFDCADKDSLDLLDKMLCVNFEKRISIDEVLAHKCLNEGSYSDVTLPV